MFWTQGSIARPCPAAVRATSEIASLEESDRTEGLC